MNILEKIEIKECTGCHACYSICPKNAITMQPNHEGFLNPLIDNELCVRCNMCVNVCPVIHNKRNISSNNTVYGCYNLNLKQRLESSSGGIFRLLAEEIIKKDGYVFGAAFDKEFQVEHVCINHLKDLKKILGTKYVQSRIGNSYRQAKSLLEQGKVVLFSGTPCQIYGLKSYLRKEYNNLYTVDLICHGVPSPKIWDDYLIAKNKKQLKAILFRNKNKGIDNAPIVFYYKDGSKIEENYNDNLYLKGFIRNLYLRESCYNCHFKGISRISDFTIGDFWGIESYDENLINDYGVSIIIAHNEKFLQLIHNITDKIYLKEFPLEASYSFNSCLVKSVNMPKERRKFFLEYKRRGLERTILIFSKRLDKKLKIKSKIYNIPLKIYMKIKKNFINDK